MPPRAGGDGAQELAEQVERHFSTPVRRGFLSSTREELPDKLVCLLDHDCTRHSLRWDRLKNGDGLRAAALRAAAERLDCEVFLTQADVHESWSCEGDEDDSWSSRRRRWGGWSEPSPDPDSLELIELYDTEIELRHWIDAAGKPFQGAVSGVDDHEVCYTTASVELEPFKSQHEGWMGNYGNTVDRWYHRAAVVMWPRKRAFSIRARSSPTWALDELLRLLRARRVEEARQKAGTLVPFWSTLSGREAGKPFFTKALRVAELLDEPQLAAALLEPLRLQQLGAKAVPHVIRLLEGHGLPWWRDRFAHWLAHEGPRGERETWLQLMPTQCRELRERGVVPGMLAQVIVAEQWALTAGRCAEALESRGRRHAQSLLDDLSHEVVQVLLGCVEADNEDVRDRVVELLTDPETAFPVGALVSGLQACKDVQRLWTYGLSELHEHCLAEVERVLAVPSRSRDDWSLEPPGETAAAISARSWRSSWPRPIACASPGPWPSRSGGTSMISSTGMTFRWPTPPGGRGAPRPSCWRRSRRCSSAPRRSASATSSSGSGLRARGGVRSLEPDAAQGSPHS
ncbi:MAG: hypothetical protein AB7N76_21555 [Planctomycetota bacterium]